jgi:urease accessory protein
LKIGKPSKPLLEENTLEHRTSNFEQSLQWAPGAVGRTGELFLDYERREQSTVLSRFRCNSPWHLFPPIDLDGSGSAYTLLVNPSGGLVGGDHLSIRAHLGQKSHVLISTPSANRIYRSLGETATQSIGLHVGSGAILEWLPDVTIPFAGSRFRQKLSVSLEPGATLLLWDALASGRIACGERWKFSTLENDIRIRASSGALVSERYRIGDKVALGLTTGWDYVGTFYLIGDSVTADLWQMIEQQIAEELDARSRILGGVSEPAGGGRVVKLLAGTAPDFQEAFEAVWGVARRLLWGLSVPDLRRY